MPDTTPVARNGAAVLPWDDSIYERLLQQRIIVLGQQVDDEIANRICAQMLLLAADDPDTDISLYINSPATEAKDYGFVDHVISRIGQVSH